MKDKPVEDLKIEMLLYNRGELRNIESGLAEINPNPKGDTFYLKVWASGPSGLGGEIEVALEILKAHVIAAARASRIISEGSNDLSLPAVVNKHLDQQIKECSCGKKGFRGLSFCDIDQYGKTKSEYICSFCGSTESFTIDHSDLLAQF